MPYKDPAQQRQYQRDRTARTRAAWFKGKVCVQCGSGEELRLDHIDPSTKVSHVVWSWSESRRQSELVKCQVLCQPCHVVKTRENQEQARGEAHGGAKLSSLDVIEIRKRWGRGETQVDLAREYGVIKQNIWEIVHRKTWKHI